MKIIQFLPYFPPHKWWLEFHAEEWSKWRVKKWYWDVLNIVTSIWQFENFYEKNWYKVYVIPAFDLIYGFPLPKFRTKRFWGVIKIIKDFQPNIIQTRTRFFVTSLIWGMFAKLLKINFIHIEHWVDYVKLNSWWKNIFAYIYDQIFWRIVFLMADKIIWISNWCKLFVNRFTKKNVDVIYRWVEVDNEKWRMNNGESGMINIWYVGRLVKLKWVDLLLESFKNLIEKWYENIILHIVWDWDEINNLVKYVRDNWMENNIIFYWMKDKKYIIDKIYPNIDIVVNFSYQEWLPSNIVEWLMIWKVAVATDVWWTKEISKLDDMILVKSWNIDDMTVGLENAIVNFNDLKWKSKQLVLERFDWDKNIENYYVIYKELIWNER
jgi:hypothetical protein